jgi:hypothetical protein
MTNRKGAPTAPLESDQLSTEYATRKLPRQGTVIAFAKPQAEDLSDEDYERYQLPLDLANLPDGPDGSKILRSR